MAPSRVGLTPLRRGVGAALVVLLLIGAIVYYWRSETNPSVAASGPSAASSAGPSAGVDATPSTPTPTPGVGGQSASVPPEPTIEVYGGNSISTVPFETVRIRGTYHRGADTFVHAERREGARWVPFPLRAKTDQLGRFIIHVEFGASGPYWVRVVDPATNVVSRSFVVSVAGR